MGDRLMNEGPQWIIFVTWLLINVGIFIGYYFKYQDSTSYHYLRVITGVYLALARASAASLNFNCMLILMPVCRNIISFLRGSCQCCKRNIRRQLDKCLLFHKWVAYMICFQTAIHYFAHCFNFERFIDAHYDKGLQSALTNLPTMSNGTWLNPIRSPNTNPMLEAVKGVPGITGVVITIILIVILSSSTEIIMRSYYEVFWYTHHLFVIFFIGLVTHALGGLVRGQSNVAVHDPLYCQDKYTRWGKPDLPECPDPQFAPGPPQTWQWVIVPVFLYVLERCLRFFRSRQKVTIVQVTKHPSRVLELRMTKDGFSATPGQYIFLHCPTISKLEWHPFTLTSAPQDEFFSVHIRLVGDWTNDLAKACEDPDNLPSVAVDGPFGTCSEDAYRYQVSVLIGAGIGVTPFASILRDIWYKLGDPDMKLKKVHFFWICADTKAFEWFAGYLQDLEQEIVETGKAGLLDINIYLTRGWNLKKALSIISHERDEVDCLTGLAQKTQFGRPNFDSHFSKIAQSHPGVRIGAFFCGPKPLSSMLHKLSNKYSESGLNGTHFVFNAENF